MKKIAHCSLRRCDCGLCFEDATVHESLISDDDAAVLQEDVQVLPSGDDFYDGCAHDNHKLDQRMGLESFISPFGGFLRISSSCTDVTADCAQKTQLCNDPAYQSMVNTYCRKTCNRCFVITTTASPSGCTDVTPDCAAKKDLCSIPSYNSMMLQYCRNTCNLCAAPTVTTAATTTAASCVDVTPDCLNKTAMCTMAAYQSMMQTYCKKSCKFC
ncbi:hypothetical protein PRIPAC_97348 [Pristionchus pacificus]|uniref:ShK domain-containing protein n=1 Tax=Pristionchus pacificus TaxID=54126 RepID=A0A2A6CTL6_PRIPA|nr:hypothetical protein PRIPAC_97348 [Pristionchus pacificus]|eukprot:PDM81572.1 ShK domain-containing protein [Pristionchus pacificus]